MDPRRAARVAEALREELEEVIVYEMKDPRIDADGVAEVLISPDARRASVRLALTGDAGKQQETVDALNHARNFLRREMARRLDMFRVPELRFEATVSAELGSKIEHLLKRVRKGRPRPESPGEKKAVE